VRRAHKIIVPDNPPPYTICEHNLGNLDEIRIREKTEFVGSFSDMTFQKGSETHIFAPISGPLGTRAKLIKTIVPILTRIETKSIVSLGEPHNRAVKKHGACQINGWLSRNQREEYMRNAKIVIFSGGHGTCFEVIKYRKPSICIPTQPEQMANAKKLQELNCSLTAENEAQLKRALSGIEEKTQFYKNNVTKINEISSRLNGIERAVDVIENSA
jgi:uncharacterized protein (TIGR00661 family)